jgi:hypothetical protein
MSKTVAEKEDEIRKNISSLINELRSTTRSSKLFKEFKELSFQDQKSEIKEKLKDFKKSDVGSAFADMIKEVFKRDAKTEQELKDKQESIKTIREQIKKNSNILATDEYQKLLEQIELSDEALKEDFKSKYSLYSKMTGMFNKKMLDTTAIVTALATRDPLIGLGVKATGMMGGMMLSGVKNLYGYASGKEQDDSVETNIREKTIVNLQKKLKNLRRDPTEKTTVRSARAGDSKMMSGEYIPILEKILYSTEETYLETAESKDILSRILRIQEDLYALEEMKIFDDLENEKENRESQKKQLSLSEKMNEKLAGSSSLFGDKDNKENKGIIGQITDKITEIGTSVIVASAALGRFKGLLKGATRIIGKGAGPLGLLSAAYFGKKTAEELGTSFSSGFLAELLTGIPDTIGLGEYFETFQTKKLAKEIDYLEKLNENLLLEPARIGFGALSSIGDSISDFYSEKQYDNIKKLLDTIEKKKSIDPNSLSEKEKQKNEKEILSAQERILRIQKLLLSKYGFEFKSDIERNQKIIDAKMKQKDIQIIDSPLKSRMPEQSFGGDMVEKLYNALAVAETGGEKDPFIRTRVVPKTTKDISSAFGPVQITKNLVRGHLELGTFKGDSELEEFVKKYIEQGEKFVDYSLGKINDPRFALGGPGELTSEKDRKMYKMMAMKMIERDLSAVGGDTSQFMKEWRFGATDANIKEDDEYFAKIQGALNEYNIGTKSKDGEIYGQRNDKPNNVINLSKSNEELKAKQLAKNNVNIQNVSHSPTPGSVNGPSNTPSSSSVRNTDSTLSRIMDRTYRGTSS